MKKRNIIITVGVVSGLAAVAAVGSRVLNKREENDSEYTDADTDRGLKKSATFYEKYVKRAIDVSVAFVGAVATAPIVAVASVLIYKEDPGSVIFKQKRVGIHKTYFNIHKLRSMKQNAGDIPTHLLSKEEQDNLILKIGRVIRKTSIDELPQCVDILRGRMSIVGPRPALWNQNDLVAERDKYGANDIRPGLTGWAQINGRDALEIAEKARLDGIYCRELRKSSWSGFKMDCKCFFGTIQSVIRSDGVVEGGTGSAVKVGRHFTDAKTDSELIGEIGFGEPVAIEERAKKRVLITGVGSYIGESFTEYAKNHYADNFEIDAVDVREDSWREKDFSGYDVVYHVAGIAHADVGHVSDEIKETYYAVNTDLAIETAKKAKTAGVPEFIFMSSMIVYGDSAPYGKDKIIDAQTVPTPTNFYGNSKLQADVAVRELADDRFKVIVLRPPMIYGRGSRGNYPLLAKLAKKLPVFPDVDNKRSMLYIDNLCEFLCQIMLIREMRQNATVLIPQNAEWTKTADMVKRIAGVSGRDITELKALRPAVAMGSMMPGKIGELVNKAFGNSCYAQEVSVYPGIDYQNISLDESILRTEKSVGQESSSVGTGLKKKFRKHILVVSQYFYPEQFRINDICCEWVQRGYKVTVVTGIPNYPMGKTFDGYSLTKKRHEKWKGMEIIRIPLIPRGSSSIGMIANYMSFMISGIIAGKRKNIKADYIFSYEVSPMTQVLAGISFAKKLGVPHYLYVQDLWPENVMTVTGIKNSMVIRPIDKMVDYIYQNVDEIFATSPSFVEAICSRRLKVPREKVHYWPQYAEEFYHPLEKKPVPEIPDDDSFKVIFTGNIGTAQGLHILPRTAALLKDENVRFVMVGDGRYLKEFRDEIFKYDVKDKFVMVPRQPAERIPELLAACDAAFLSFQDADLWAMTIPAKLQSYMACGMPVIASAQGETKRVIEEAGCGVCTPIGDAAALSEAVKDLRNANLVELGRNGRDYFEKNFGKRMLMEQIEKYFR